MNGQHWDGAYYVAGYAVEFAIKIILIKQITTSQALPPKEDLNAYYSHDLEKLLRLTGLDRVLDEDEQLTHAWKTTKNWNEQQRYTIGKTLASAVELIQAIIQVILPWLKTHW